MRLAFPTILCIACVLWAPGTAAIEIDASFVRALLGRFIGGVPEKPPVVLRHPSNLAHMYVHLLGPHGTLIKVLPPNIRTVQVLNAAGQLVHDISRNVHFMKLLDPSPDNPNIHYVQILEAIDPLIKRYLTDPEESRFKFELRRLDTDDGGVNWDIERFGDGKSEEISFVDMDQNENIQYLLVASPLGESRFKLVQSAGRMRIIPIKEDVPGVKFTTITVSVN